MMSNDFDGLRNAGDGPPTPPQWATYLAIGGVVAAGIAAAVNIMIDGSEPDLRNLSSDTNFKAILRLILPAGAMVAAGIAVWLRPSHVGILTAACVTGLLARFGFHPAWDSARMLAGFGSIAAGGAAVLMALPQSYRRFAVSVLILVHFGSICAQVTGPPTHGSPAPWLTQAANVYVYRPYSQFVYLTNAYHFYSPEPGAANQLWFCIHYKKKDAKPGESPYGDTRWFKLPRRPQDMTDPLALSYYRRLSLTMQVENYAPGGPSAEAARQREVRSYGQYGIPWHPALSRERQFSAPAEAVRSFLLPSFVHHVARLPVCQHDDGVTPIYSVKVYRVEHRILPPLDLKSSGFYDPQTYFPYFLGEYDADGTPLNTGDPMLNWLVPIFYLPKSADVQPWENPKDNPDKFILKDGVKIHAGSDHELR